MGLQRSCILEVLPFQQVGLINGFTEQLAGDVRLGRVEEGRPVPVDTHRVLHRFVAVVKH